MAYTTVWFTIYKSITPSPQPFCSNNRLRQSPRPYAHFEGIREKRDIAPILLNPGTRWRWMVSFMSQPINPPLPTFHSREIALCTHWILGWLGPRADLDFLRRKKKSCPCQELNPHCIKHQHLSDLSPFPTGSITKKYAVSADVSFMKN